MKAWVWMRVLLLTGVAAIGGCRAYPTRSIYRSPVISSVLAFPNVLGPGDSTLVTVFATDPDGDSLVYDWFTDGRLTIKDALLGHSFLFNTSSNSRVFYRSPGTTSGDSARIACSVRDGRGGLRNGVVRVYFED